MGKGKRWQIAKWENIRHQTLTVFINWEHNTLVRVYCYTYYSGLQVQSPQVKLPLPLQSVEL